MKASALKTTGYGLVVLLTVLGISASAHAADFFPLDVWETLTDRQPGTAAIDQGFTASVGQPTPATTGAAATLELAFPFDVARTLDPSDRRDRRVAEERSYSVSRVFKTPPNPYWLPEEFHHMGGRLLTWNVQRN